MSLAVGCCRLEKGILLYSDPDIQDWFSADDRMAGEVPGKLVPQLIAFHSLAGRFFLVMCLAEH